MGLLEAHGGVDLVKRDAEPVGYHFGALVGAEGGKQGGGRHRRARNARCAEGVLRIDDDGRVLSHWPPAHGLARHTVVVELLDERVEDGDIDELSALAVEKVLTSVSVESFEDGLTVRFELLDAEGVTDLELLRCFALHQSYRAHRHALIDEGLHEQNLDEIDERENSLAAAALAMEKRIRPTLVTRSTLVAVSFDPPANARCIQLGEARHVRHKIDTPCELVGVVLGFVHGVLLQASHCHKSSGFAE